MGWETETDKERQKHRDREPKVSGLWRKAGGLWHAPSMDVCSQKAQVQLSYTDDAALSELLSRGATITGEDSRQNSAKHQSVPQTRVLVK